MRTRELRVSLLLAALVGNAFGGCVAESPFHCANNDGCLAENGSRGICEPNATCSFADAACTESGRRYADGGSCVGASQSCVASLGLGSTHSCLVRTDGSVWCWGSNDEGQLGDGTTNAHSVPTRVSLPAGVVARSVTAGETHTCALTDDGRVFCWGANDTHQLGAVEDERRLAPVYVPIVVDDGETETELRATAISAGGKHTCAVADKFVYCWGENSDGQCGADPTSADDVLRPTVVAGADGVIGVSTGDEFSCVLQDDKSVRCFGSNESGELGDGSQTASSQPVKAQIASVTALAAGDETACGLKDDGSVWCWGYGHSGAIGVGSTADQLVPAAVTSARGISASGESFHVCALSDRGALRCWGANDSGQLGASRSEEQALSPVEAHLIAVKSVALGAKHTCAVTFDGQLWCWGANDLGQLGLGTTGASQLSPARVSVRCD